LIGREREREREREKEYLLFCSEIKKKKFFFSEKLKNKFGVVTEMLLPRSTLLCSTVQLFNKIIIVDNIPINNLLNGKVTYYRFYGTYVRVSTNNNDS